MKKNQSRDKAGVVAYIRTASGREGITKQRKEIEEFAEKAGITIDEFLELEAVRAEKGIIELFRRLRPNDRLIITDFSRLTRKLTDLPEIINKLKSNEIHVTSLNMSGTVDAMIEKKLRKCALYARVYGNAQSEHLSWLSTEQIERMKSYCASQGWEDVTVYCDEEVSGKNKKVPSFHHMMSDIAKGRFNTLIVTKLNRLSRSMIAFEKIFKTLEAQGVDMISLHENIDSSTAVGKAVIRIALSFACRQRGSV